MSVSLDHRALDKIVDFLLFQSLNRMTRSLVPRSPRTALAAALFFGLGTSTSLMAQDDGLRRCRAIQDPAARLACYDALVPAQPASLPSSRGPIPGPATQAPAPTREAALASPVERFGLEHKASPERADRIESYIPGTFHGWGPNSEITLANGQVWKVVDGSTMASVWQNPKVHIRRGSFGSFFLDMEGETRSARVRRIK